MSAETKLHLFDAFGIELEYMIVDRAALNVQPISHVILRDETGTPVSEIEHGPLAISNELTHHVIEVKTNGPRSSLIGLAQDFQTEVQSVNEALQAENARLLPTAMHPWMQPDQEMKLWPFDYSPVYNAFHRVFDCRGHGWANLQSMHINLPFHGDEEFSRLHAAIRILLPVLPGLAASSPFIEGVSQGNLDQRLYAYANNSRKIPSVSGRVIPEPYFTHDDYVAGIFEPMYSEIAPHDPDGVLQDEFLNARGAIARFDRNAIEIRVIDVQECPAADLAIASLTIAVLKKLTQETWTPLESQQSWNVEPLREIFDAVTRDAENTVLDDTAYLQLFGLNTPSATVQELWLHLFEICEPQIEKDCPEVIPHIKMILQQGSLASRIVNSIGRTPSSEQLRNTYQQLADCLQLGVMFSGAVQ